MAAMLEAKDAYTLGHSRRVTRHAERIAREMGLSGEDVARIRIAASVHDIGKVHTPRQILTKPSSLTVAELAIMKRHPLDGAKMVAEIGDPAITAMVRHHHERLDGSGYPEGLCGEEIPLGARIISVADTFDAITSSRAYHGARKHRPALDVVSAEAGSRLDPDAVAAFLRYYSGKRAVAWSALGLTGSPRLVSWVSGLLGGVGRAAPLTQSFAAISAAALVGASLGGQPATAAGERASPGARGSESDSVARAGIAGRSGEPAGGRGERTPRYRLAPVSGRPENRPERDAPSDDSPGGIAPPGGPDSTAPGDPPPVPRGEAPGGEQPGGELPDVHLPDVHLPDVQLPDVRLPRIDAPELVLPNVEVPLSRALPGAEDLILEPPTLRLPTGALE